MGNDFSFSSAHGFHARQKLIRAKVTRYPYHSEGRNDTVDVNAIPRGTRD